MLSGIDGNRQEESRESGKAPAWTLVGLSKLTTEMILDFEQADIGDYFVFKTQLTDFSLKKHFLHG